ncbi:MAG TPA: periplasmic heavy metal sensor [Chthoniobacteraceae bacterium]|nr:periplasmic heavy metal sensor [Chthoniobacteraceae bacterium]
MKKTNLLTLLVAAATAVSFSTPLLVAQDAASSPEAAATASDTGSKADKANKRDRKRADRQRPRGGDRMRGAGGFGHVGSQLNLTDEQRQTIQNLLRETRPTLQPLLEKLDGARKELSKAAEATPVDETAIRAKASDLATTEADLAVQKAQLFSKIKATLTPEQVERLSSLEGASDQLLRGALSRMGNREGRGMHPRGPRPPKADHSKPSADAQDDGGDE